MAEIELLPCPFCGGEAYTWSNTVCEWRAECKQCGASSLSHTSQYIAAGAWNCRYLSKEIRLEGDRLYFEGLGTFERVKE